MPELSEHYSTGDLRSRITNAIREAGMDPRGPLSIEQLAPLDHFHTAALFGTRSLAELVEIDEDTRVLDVGAGLGGSARYLASTYGCTVTSLEPVGDFRDAAALLNELTGLAARVSVEPGDAIAMPFEADSYNLVWTQNATMNIEDKAGLFSEIHRVLTPGGSYAFHEVAAGPQQPIHFPVPWASSAEMNFLIPPNETRRIAERAGFEVLVFEEKPPPPPAPDPGAPPNPLSFGIFLPDAAEKFANARRNGAEGRIGGLRGVFRAI